jgi:type IV secretory pathway VirB3-like protein
MNNKNKIKIVILWLVFLGVCIVPIFIWLIKYNLLFAVIIPVILLSIYILIIKKSNLRKTKGEKIIEKAVEDGTVVYG